MTYYLSELYSPKPSWLNLEAKQREAFFDNIGMGMAQLAELGIEIITMTEVAQNKPYAAPQRFLALWKLPNEAALDALLAGISSSGWHDYFDTINAAGTATDMATHLTQLSKI